jgi:uncharacterized membrane protein
MGIILLIILLSFTILTYYKYGIETFLVTSFSILTLIGLFNRLLIYYLHDNSNVISFANILLFVPLFYIVVKRAKQIKMKFSNIMIFIFYLLVVVQFFNFSNSPF